MSADLHIPIPRGYDRTADNWPSHRARARARRANKKRHRRERQAKGHH